MRLRVVFASSCGFPSLENNGYDGAQRISTRRKTCSLKRKTSITRDKDEINNERHEEGVGSNGPVAPILVHVLQDQLQSISDLALHVQEEAGLNYKPALYLDGCLLRNHQSTILLRDDDTLWAVNDSNPLSQASSLGLLGKTMDLAQSLNIISSIQLGALLSHKHTPISQLENSIFHSISPISSSTPKQNVGAQLSTHAETVASIVHQDTQRKRAKITKGQLSDEILQGLHQHNTNHGADRLVDSESETDKILRIKKQKKAKKSKKSNELDSNKTKTARQSKENAREQKIERSDKKKRQQDAGNEVINVASEGDPSNTSRVKKRSKNTIDHESNYQNTTKNIDASIIMDIANSNDDVGMDTTGITTASTPTKGTRKRRRRRRGRKQQTQDEHKCTQQENPEQPEQRSQQEQKQPKHQTQQSAVTEEHLAHHTETTVSISANNSTVQSNFELWPPLLDEPVPGHHLAIKVVELSDTYSPEVSSFKECHVLSIEPTENTIRVRLAPHSIKPKVTGKFDLPISNDNEVLYDSRSHHDVEYFITNIVDMRVCPA